MLSEDEKQAAIKAADEEWWKGWWEADFSWEGLAKGREYDTPWHPWRGWSVVDGCLVVPRDKAPVSARTATLQDYFRWDFETETLRDDDAMIEAGLLHSQDGHRTFHILHLPERWRNGDFSWKRELKNSHWKTVETELAHRLGHAQRTEISFDQGINGADCRAQLDGVQIQTLPALPISRESKPDVIHMTAAWTRWLTTANFAARVFGSGVSFDQAQFSGGDANFEDAQFFDGYSSFSNTHFSGGAAVFKSARFFGGIAFFMNAQFSGGDAEFQNSQFAGGEAFFSRAHFSGGDANFNNALFSGGDAFFGNAQFSGGDAYFNGALISGGDTYFNNAQFTGGTARFNGMYNVGELSLGQTNSTKQPEASAIWGLRMNDAVCLSTFEVTDREFSSPAVFSNTHFFSRAVFHGTQIHEGTQWKNTRFRFSSEMKPIRWTWWHQAHNQTRKTINLGLKKLKLSMRLPPDEHIPFPALSNLKIQLNQHAGRDPTKHEAECLDKTYAISRTDFNNRGTYAYAFEADYRTLKRLMEHIGARNEEQRFFALELKARRARRFPDPSKVGETHDHDVKAWEAFFAGLYGAISDYGQSLTRILGWLCGLWLVMAGVYLCLALTVPRPAPTLAEPYGPRLVSATNGEASPSPTRWQQYLADNRTAAFTGPLLYALEMTLVPVVNPGGHHPWTDALEAPGAGRHPYWFAFVRMAHRLLAIPLLFLFLLTLRRRFQID